MARRNRKQPLQSLLISDSLVWGLGIAFAIATIITAVLTFIAVRDFAASRQRQQPVAAPVIETPEPTPDIPMDQPLQTSGRPTAEAWDGKERINILLMGLDYRDWAIGEGPARTDTMILFSVDPETHTAGMLSIPRDLWVNIPGFNYAKINTAYYLGEAYGLPGGGPGLAMETVENFLGMPVHYYAQIDFGAFVSFIDEIGGVKIDVPEKITIDLLGDGHQTIKTLKPGVQVLPGDMTLAYARARHTNGGDFDRAQRQQQVVLGIRDRILDLEMLPTLVSKAPALYLEISKGINSNLSLNEIIRLAWLAKDVPLENILSGAIGPEQVSFDTSPDGQYILRPLPEEIRIVRDQVFSGRPQIEPVMPATETSPSELMQSEQAAISLQNGTYTVGLAGRTSEYLTEMGLGIVDTSNADQVYELTTIIDYTGNPYTLQFLIDTLDVQPSRVFSSFDLNSPVDIAVLLGNDWANNNPLP